MTTPILVVDDEPKTLLVSSDILGMDGYEVDTARDGSEALEKFAPGRHAAVVTDIRMPGMSGIELVERIRARDGSVPIVIITGYATVETATRAISAGAFEYLFKPIDFDKLKITLRRAIERYRLLEENKRLVAELTAANRLLEAQSSELERQVARRTRDLAYERDLLENVVAATPTGIAVLAADRSVARANDAFRRLGVAGGELLHRLEREIAAIAAGAPAIRGRELVVAEPGTGAEWALRVSVVALAGGRALVVADDVTEAARVEDELVQVEKLLSLGTLAGGIVHDLANPITAVLGTAEVLLEEVPPGDARRASLEAIHSSASYMRDVCGGLTEFSRRVRRGEAFAVRPGEVVEKAIAFARYSKKLAGVEVETRIAPDLPPVAASPSELIQVLVNLIVNGCDAMAAAGGRARLEIAAERTERAVRIAVRDHGPGVPEDVRPRLFEPFFTTKGVGKGTGLGLFTSRRIVRRLGGCIGFTTGADGTTFTLEIPAAAI